MKAQFVIASAGLPDYTLKRQMDWFMEPDAAVKTRRQEAEDRMGIFHFACRAARNPRPRAPRWGVLPRLGLALLALVLAAPARANLQFDVFLGYGGADARPRGRAAATGRAPRA